MFTLFFVFSLLLNLYHSAVLEFDDIGVIEHIETPETENPTTTELQDLLRRRLMPGGFSNDDKISILNAHNNYRDLTAQGQTYGQPSASNMNKLVWDAGLAQVAQDYSAKCIWAHNANRHSDMVKYEGIASFDYDNQQVGENLFITTGSENINSILQGIQYWYSEYTYYTYGTVAGSSTCTSGKQCGHYTQLIWATTRYVGCGYTKCATASGVSFTNSLLFVCNYYFSGNIVGYYPYTIGTAGTQCSADRSCDSNNMCSGCPSAAWDTYCCQYCSSSSCLNAISSNLLNPPSSCTNGLGTSMTSSSSVSLSAPAPAVTTTTPSPTTSSPTTHAPTTKAPTSRPTTNAPVIATTTTTTTTTTRSPTATMTTTRAPTQSTSAAASATASATASASNGCCIDINSRYATFCASISGSSVCSSYPTLCSWNC